MTDDEQHGWTHPQCHVCFFDEYGLEREPVRLKHPRREKCCYCGQPTLSGIYRRTRPGSVEIPHCADTQIDRSIFHVQ